MNNVLLKTVAEFLFNWRYVYFVWALEYLVKKPPVLTKWGTVSSIKVKPCTVLLRKLQVCVSMYLKSVLRYIIFNFQYLSSGHCIYVSNDVRIRGCFPKS